MTEPVTIERQIAAVRDELSLRRRVYPRWISAGRMQPDVAERRIAEMEAVRATLEQLRDQDRQRREPELF